jgi:hypothetical protein
MPRTRAASTVQKPEPVVVPREVPAAALAPRSRLPNWLRFPLLVITSFSFSTVLLGLTSRFMRGELKAISRSLNEDWQVAAGLGWRVVELAVGWFGEYDGKTQ